MKKSRLPLIALGVSLLSLILGFMPLMGMVLAVIGFFLGVRSMKSPRKGLAIAAMLIAVLTLISEFFLIFVYLWSFMGP